MFHVALRLSVTSTSIRASACHAAVTPAKVKVNAIPENCTSLAIHSYHLHHFSHLSFILLTITSLRRQDSGYKLQSPSMKRRYSDTDLASFAIKPTTTVDNDIMGRPYRTPSPAPEAYISSSKLIEGIELRWHQLTMSR
jgi:hypothetical protein